MNKEAFFCPPRHLILFSTVTWCFSANLFVWMWAVFWFSLLMFNNFFTRLQMTPNYPSIATDHNIGNSSRQYKSTYAKYPSGVQLPRMTVHQALNRLHFTITTLSPSFLPSLVHAPGTHNIKWRRNMLRLRKKKLYLPQNKNEWQQNIWLASESVAVLDVFITCFITTSHPRVAMYRRAIMARKLVRQRHHRLVYWVSSHTGIGVKWKWANFCSKNVVEK